MNTKVEEALGALASAESNLHALGAPRLSRELASSITTLAAHIAQQDATIAESREGWHMANGVAELAMKHRDAAEAALASDTGERGVAALEVFRIAGGDVECCPAPTAEQALECLRDLRECYAEALRAQPAGGGCNCLADVAGDTHLTGCPLFAPPESGGQGEYVRHLGGGLLALYRGDEQVREIGITPGWNFRDRDEFIVRYNSLTQGGGNGR